MHAMVRVVTRKRIGLTAITSSASDLLVDLHRAELGGEPAADLGGQRERGDQWRQLAGVGAAE